MKVLNILWKFGSGGIARCFLTYASLADAGGNVEVVSVCINPRGGAYDKGLLNAAKVVDIGIAGGKDFSWMKRVNEIVRRTTPDVIFCHGFNGPIVVAALKLRYWLKTPVVCSYHGEYYAPSASKKWRPPLFNGLMHLLYRVMAKKVVVVSEYSKRELLRVGVSRQKLIVVHNGIPTVASVCKRQCGEAVRIGVVARLDPFKGIDDLIEAVGLLRGRTTIPFLLDIVGDGPMGGVLKSCVADRGLQDIVTFRGYQSNISEWMSKWDVFCLPSYFENHSISILEAMRGGLSIVTTRVGGNEESVSDGVEALIVEPKDVEGLASALLRLISDNDLRARLGMNAQDRFRREFTEEIMKRNIIAALSDAV